MGKSCGSWRQFSRGRNQELEQKPAAPASGVVRFVAAESQRQPTAAAPRALFPSKTPGKQMGLTRATARGNSKGIRKGTYNKHQCFAGG